MNGVTVMNFGLEQCLSMDNSDAHLPHHGDENKGDLITLKVSCQEGLYV